MPLTPEAQRARRAAQKKAQPPADIPRRHCKNCNKIFLKTRPNREFCTRDCKNEFNRFGAAFGPLKEKLFKLIEQKSREDAAAIAASESFRRELIKSGFLHRSALKKRPPERTPEGLQAPLTAQSGQIRLVKTGQICPLWTGQFPAAPSRIESAREKTPSPCPSLVTREADRSNQQTTARA